MNRQTLIAILDLARWAPSGDNTQPWRFEIVDDSKLRIHGFDLRENCLYDLGGYTSWMAHGALLETLRIAATRFGLVAESTLQPGSPDSAPVYDVVLRPAADLAPDPLLPCIEKRVVQRRPMRTTPLSEAQRQALQSAVGADYQLQFFEHFSARRAVAKLLSDSGYIRLVCPEAFAVHREIIEWGARFSTDRLPEESIGVDPLSAKMMKWALHSWSRVEFMNRYLLGTVFPRVQLDVVPALACAGHILMRTTKSPRSVADFVAAGVAMQRLWLTVCALGLHLQPQMTPVVFRWYARSGLSMSSLPEINRRVLAVAERFERLAAAKADDSFVFLCRVGRCEVPISRATRKPLNELMVKVCVPREREAGQA